MPYVPTWKERLEEARPYVMPAVAGLIVLGLAGWLVGHEVLPRLARNRSAAAQIATRGAAGDEGEEWEKSYREAVVAGAADSDLAAQLDRVIERLRERIRLAPRAATEARARLAPLERERAALRARHAAAESASLEKQAAAAREAGQGATALEQLREALRLRQEANANAPSPELRDVAREARLSQAIETLEAEPLHAAVDISLTLAAAAAAREEWDEAIKAYAGAREAQSRLNQRYAATRYASVAAIDRIDAEVASLRAAGAAATIAARERDGEAAARAGRWQEAAALYGAAADLQADVNEKFPRSRFAAIARVAEFRMKHDTILSRALVAEAMDLDREITAALARRQTVAAGEKIGSAQALVAKAAADFPNGLALDGDLLAKLAFLGLRRAELAARQGQIYGALLPLPGAPKLRMYRTEVPQELYAWVMNASPSRHTGPALPVDSVSWDDTQEFCRRVSWLLGCRVRLPSLAEFRAAGGAESGRASVAATGAGGMQSREPGELTASGAGFDGLHGNLAEWLQPDSTQGDTAPVAGGSYLDPAGVPDTMPVVSMERRGRARHVGFRVVVESPAG